MSEQLYLILEEEEGLATITMNRGEKRNPLSTAMMSALIDTFEKLGARREVRAVILAGAGVAFGFDAASFLASAVSLNIFRLE